MWRSVVNALAKLLEAALFASPRPIPAAELEKLDSDASAGDLASALEELRTHYDADEHDRPALFRSVDEPSARNP